MIDFCQKARQRISIHFEQDSVIDGVLLTMGKVCSWMVNEAEDRSSRLLLGFLTDFSRQLEQGKPCITISRNVRINFVMKGNFHVLDAIGFQMYVLRIEKVNPRMAWFLKEVVADDRIFRFASRVVRLELLLFRQFFLKHRDNAILNQIHQERSIFEEFLRNSGYMIQPSPQVHPPLQRSNSASSSPHTNQSLILSVLD
jgi:hypothetical protein